MHKVQFHYTLGEDRVGRDAGSGAGALVRHPLLELLHAVVQAGSISGAARSLGLSYRHVWGELKRWEGVLGHDLIVWEKGQSAQLTGFGAKLLWAERQAQARLAPQIEALRGELERAFAVAFDDRAQLLTLYASHDDALLQLRGHCAREALHLDVRFCGSVDAIQALNQGRCALAGFHATEAPARDSATARAYRPLLRPGVHKIIGFARRTQGLIVAPGNTLGLQRLADVAVTGARLANRAIGTGTRVLLDDLLAAEGVAAQRIRGYDSAEPSHASVAAAVAAGSADVGLGIEAAAQALGLGFVPLVHERYHLACLKSALDSPPVLALRAVLAQAEWQAALAALPGYAPDASAQVLPLRQVLPWWTFRSAKRGG